MPIDTIRERFEQKYVPSPDGCWDWADKLDPRGYGRLGVAGRAKYAHRIAHELHKGPIPEGLVIDHLCCNRACVNPDHLEAVTLNENGRRNAGKPALGSNNRNKTECPSGHDYADAYQRADGSRACGPCHRAKSNRVRNAQRDSRARCDQGHLLMGSNLILYRTGGRRCHKCVTESQRARRRRERALEG